jgi:hypothetical protein
MIDEGPRDLRLDFVPDNRRVEFSSPRICACQWVETPMALG